MSLRRFSFFTFFIATIVSGLGLLASAPLTELKSRIPRPQIVLAFPGGGIPSAAQCTWALNLKPAPGVDPPEVRP